MHTTPHIDTALNLAKQAGVIMRANFTAGMKKEWKDERSPVTETDLAVNDLVLKEIKKHYPDHSILSEEGNDFSEESEFVWICDPVDGTHNFSHGIPTATFALALVRAGQPVLGVIYDPFLDRIFYAEKGKGAYMNGQVIKVTSNPLMKSTVIGMGKMKKVTNLFPVMEAMYGHGASLITGLSIHYMNALVAGGEFSGAIFGGTSPHDMTPAKVIVEEAGGRVSDLKGEMPERFDRDINGFVCSNGLLHDQMVELLKLGFA